jgi:hypothetical protein
MKGLLPALNHQFFVLNILFDDHFPKDTPKSLIIKIGYLIKKWIFLGMPYYESVWNMRKAYFPALAKSPSKSQVFWWNPLEMKLAGGGAECPGCHRTSSGRSCGTPDVEIWRSWSWGIWIYIYRLYIYIHIL